MTWPASSKAGERVRCEVLGEPDLEPDREPCRDHLRCFSPSFENTVEIADWCRDAVTAVAEVVGDKLVGVAANGSLEMPLSVEDLSRPLETVLTEGLGESVPDGTAVLLLDKS